MKSRAPPDIRMHGFLDGLPFTSGTFFSSRSAIVAVPFFCSTTFTNLLECFLHVVLLSHRQFLN